MKEGDWVKVSLMSWNVYGYLIEEGKPSRVMQVYKEFRNGEIKYEKEPKVTTFNNIHPVESSITPEDLLAMVDLSLMTRDRQWFESLYKQLYKRMEEEHA